MIDHLKFMGIPVADQDRALAFYTEKLGFAVKVDATFGPQRWIELEIPGLKTRIALFTPEGQEGRIGTFVNASFACRDVEATYQHYVERGVEFVKPPTAESWGTSAILKDSEGNLILIASEA